MQRGTPPDSRRSGRRPLSRHRRAWPAIDRTLAVWYHLRIDWPTLTLAPSEAAEATARASGPPALIRFICDVGVALEQLHRRQRELIDRRWYAHFQAEAAAVQVRAAKKTQRYTSRRLRDAHAIAGQELTLWTWHRDAWRAEKQRLERRKPYREAMLALGVELASRDLYERARRGPWAGIQRPPA